MNNQPFVIERTFYAPIATVWKAITDKDAMKQWYFDLAEFKPELGFAFSFTAGSDQTKYLHLCEISDVIPGKKIAYSWRYDGYEGISYVSFELFAEGDKTRLLLTHEGLESFSISNPDFLKINFEIGWTSILDNKLKQFMETGHA